jgi:hypothetical protein
MPYIIKPVEDGFKVCKQDDKKVCFSKKGLPKNRAKKQMAAIGISESTGGAAVEGYGKDKFIAQLDRLKFSPEAYLMVAKRVAKREGYDPEKVSFAMNNDNKLRYDSPDGPVYFGKAGYGDYIIWLFEERNNNVPKGFADQKRRVFRKSHGAMTKKYNLGKYSANELAINILW